MKTYGKIIAGNHYSVKTDFGNFNYFQLWDTTRHKLIADGNDDTELILLAQRGNMINGTIVLV